MDLNGRLAACRRRGFRTRQILLVTTQLDAEVYRVADLAELYRQRWPTEEVIRVCKDQLGLSGCQARSERAQLHHITCCLVAFCVLELERHDRCLTIYKLKRQLSYRGRTLALPALQQLSRAA